MPDIIIQTKRLTIRKSSTDDNDIDFFYAIWTNPKVMINVGFPYGLKISKDQVSNQIENQPDTEFDTRLIVTIKKTGELVGECKLGTPDDKGISETDVKLLPQFWGYKYGVEIKQALVDYLFENTDCKIVKATPNKNNIASQKMQTAVGGIKVKEGVYHFPEKKRSYTTDVPYIEYHINRSDWVKTRSLDK